MTGKEIKNAEILSRYWSNDLGHGAEYKYARIEMVTMQKYVAQMLAQFDGKSKK